MAAVEQWAALGGVPRLSLDKARKTWERYQAAQSGLPAAAS
jgi:hypothetical protein